MRLEKLFVPCQQSPVLGSNLKHKTQPFNIGFKDNENKKPIEDAFAAMNKRVQSQLVHNVDTEPSIYYQADDPNYSVP